MIILGENGGSAIVSEMGINFCECAENPGIRPTKTGLILPTGI
jgi:hypothetical protein